jgi:hypothetical protein
LAVASILTYPLISNAFSYQGTSIGINFDGSAIFTDSTLLYPGAQVCKEVIFSNSSSNAQSLDFTAAGFDSSGMFNYFTLIVKDNNQAYINKPVQNLSMDIDNPETITNLVAGENKEFTFCISVDESMDNSWQGVTAGPATFTFGFSSEEAAPVSVFGPTTTTTAGTVADTTAAGTTAGGAVAGITTPITTAGQTQGETKGEVAGETNNQNMCCNWAWWNLIPWILVLILLIWLVSMWASERRRNRDKERI